MEPGVEAGCEPVRGQRSGKDRRGRRRSSRRPTARTRRTTLACRYTTTNTRLRALRARSREHRRARNAVRFVRARRCSLRRTAMRRGPLSGAEVRWRVSECAARSRPWSAWCRELVARSWSRASGRGGRRVRAARRTFARNAFARRDVAERDRVLRRAVFRVGPAPSSRRVWRVFAGDDLDDDFSPPGFVAESATTPAITAAAVPTPASTRQAFRARCVARVGATALRPHDRGVRRPRARARRRRGALRRRVRTPAASASTSRARSECGAPGAGLRRCVQRRAGGLGGEAELDRGAIELAVDVGAQQLVEGLGAQGLFGAVHGARWVGCSEGGVWFPSISRLPSWSASAARPRAIRDRTVPGGMSSTFAISA